MAATKVRVTRKHIREGEAGNCFRCAVARAMQEATGDTEAKVFDDDFMLRLEAHGLSVVAPPRVREFVRTYDSLDRGGDGTPTITPRLTKLYPELRPFSFTLPASESPEWDERCSGCEQYFKSAELDGEGYCPGCSEKE